MIAVIKTFGRVLGNKYALGALLCLAVLLGIWIYGEARWRDGYAAYQQEMAEAAAQAERERIKDDRELRGLPVIDLCRRYLRSRRLPVDACDELRGISGERPEPGRDRRLGESGPGRP